MGTTQGWPTSGWFLSWPGFDVAYRVFIGLCVGWATGRAMARVETSW